MTSRASRNSFEKRVNPGAPFLIVRCRVACRAVFPRANEAGLARASSEEFKTVFFPPVQVVPYQMLNPIRGSVAQTEERTSREKGRKVRTTV